MSERRFSEVTVTFSQHAANLNRARGCFEEEARDFNDRVQQRIQEIVRRPSERKVKKLRWRGCADWSSQRDITWLNFYAGSQLRLDVRQPAYRNFRRAAAYLYFEIVFDVELERFVFQARLENQNSVHTDLDETVAALAHECGEERYPGAYHVKSNTAVLLRRELRPELFDDMGQSVADAIELTEAAVDLLYPDDAYSPAVEADESDEEA